MDSDEPLSVSARVAAINALKLNSLAGYKQPKVFSNAKIPEKTATTTILSDEAKCDQNPKKESTMVIEEQETTKKRTVVVDAIEKGIHTKIMNEFISDINSQYMSERKQTAESVTKTTGGTSMGEKMTSNSQATSGSERVKEVEGTTSSIQNAPKRTESSKHETDLQPIIHTSAEAELSPVKRNQSLNTSVGDSEDSNPVLADTSSLPVSRSSSVSSTSKTNMPPPPPPSSSSTTVNNVPPPPPPSVNTPAGSIASNSAPPPPPPSTASPAVPMATTSDSAQSIVKPRTTVKSNSRPPPNPPPYVPHSSFSTSNAAPSTIRTGPPPPPPPPASAGTTNTPPSVPTVASTNSVSTSCLEQPEKAKKDVTWSGSGAGKEAEVHLYEESLDISVSSPDPIRTKPTSAIVITPISFSEENLSNPPSPSLSLSVSAQTIESIQVGLESLGEQVQEIAAKAEVPQRPSSPVTDAPKEEVTTVNSDILAPASPLPSVVSPSPLLRSNSKLINPDDSLLESLELEAPLPSYTETTFSPSDTANNTTSPSTAPEQELASTTVSTPMKPEHSSPTSLVGDDGNALNQSSTAKDPQNAQQQQQQAIHGSGAPLAKPALDTTTSNDHSTLSSPSAEVSMQDHATQQNTSAVANTAPTDQPMVSPLPSAASPHPGLYSASSALTSPSPFSSPFSFPGKSQARPPTSGVSHSRSVSRASSDTHPSPLHVQSPTYPHVARLSVVSPYVTDEDMDEDARVWYERSVHGMYSPVTNVHDIPFHVIRGKSPVQQPDFMVSEVRHTQAGKTGGMRYKAGSEIEDEHLREVQVSGVFDFRMLEAKLRERENMLVEREKKAQEIESQSHFVISKMRELSSATKDFEMKKAKDEESLLTRQAILDQREQDLNAREARLKPKEEELLQLEQSIEEVITTRVNEKSRHLDALLQEAHALGDQIRTSVKEREATFLAIEELLESRMQMLVESEAQLLRSFDTLSTMLWRRESVLRHTLHELRDAMASWDPSNPIPFSSIIAKSTLQEEEVTGNHSMVPYTPGAVETITWYNTTSHFQQDYQKVDANSSGSATNTPTSAPINLSELKTLGKIAPAPSQGGDVIAWLNSVLSAIAEAEKQKYDPNGYIQSIQQMITIQKHRTNHALPLPVSIFDSTSVVSNATPAPVADRGILQKNPPALAAAAPSIPMPADAANVQQNFFVALSDRPQQNVSSNATNEDNRVSSNAASATVQSRASPESQEATTESLSTPAYNFANRTSNSSMPWKSAYGLEVPPTNPLERPASHAWLSPVPIRSASTATAVTSSAIGTSNSLGTNTLGHTFGMDGVITATGTTPYAALTSPIFISDNDDQANKSVLAQFQSTSSAFGSYSQSSVTDMTGSNLDKGIVPSAYYTASTTSLPSISQSTAATSAAAKLFPNVATQITAATYSTNASLANSVNANAIPASSRISSTYDAEFQSRFLQTKQQYGIDPSLRFDVEPPVPSSFYGYQYSAQKPVSSVNTSRDLNQSFTSTTTYDNRLPTPSRFDPPSPALHRFRVSRHKY